MSTIHNTEEGFCLIFIILFIIVIYWPTTSIWGIVLQGAKSKYSTPQGLRLIIQNTFFLGLHIVFNVSIKAQHSTKCMRIFRFLSHDLVSTNGYQYWWFQVERAMALNQPISQASIVQTFFTMVCRCVKVFLSARLYKCITALGWNIYIIPTHFNKKWEL